MIRQQALECLVENLSEWVISPNFEGWYWWSSPLGDIELISICSAETSITKQDWLDAKTKKEQQVEIDWSNAPEGATHYSPETEDLFFCWWKIGVDTFFICPDDYVNDWEIGVCDESRKLIPRPTITPYIPQVGEECEVLFHDDDKPRWYRTKFVAIVDDRAVLIYENDVEWPASKKFEFRPLKTEREKFIEMATKDYLDQVGSDAVDEKWFGRIFGAMYDKRYRKND